jgi:hypothetical protein
VLAVGVAARGAEADVVGLPPAAKASMAPPVKSATKRSSAPSMARPRQPCATSTTPNGTRRGGDRRSR